MTRLTPVVLLITACSLGGPGLTSQPTTSTTSEPSATPTLLLTVPPSASPTPQPTPSPTDPPSQADQPPDGLLAADGEPVNGELGTFCWGDTCIDGPTPRKNTLPQLSVGSGGHLTFALADGTAFREWYAYYSESSNGDATRLAHGAVDGPELAEVTFPSPPPGDWVIHVSIYPDGGDASYAWHVTVD